VSILSRVGGSVLLPRQDIASESVGHGRYSPYVAAKVIDFYPDPRLLSDTQKEVIRKSVEAGSLVDRMPINSIWCQVLGAGRLDQHIAYPFFPPHLSLPLKPTEEVWVVYDGVMYYWMCRRVGDYQSEDINYTFVARAANPDPGNLSAKDAFNGSNKNVNSFPQGNTDSIYNSTLGSLNTDDKIIERSASYQTGFTPEAVPRIVRNPGDLVIQGSNNSSIKLGNSINQVGRGIVDIVAGHKLETIPVTNTRGNKEIDKSQAASKDGPTDFIIDKTRLYLAMNDNPDSNFFINIEGIDGSGEGACAVVKSDQVRLVARNDVKIKAENSNAAVVIRANGDIFVVPGSEGQVYLAGASSDQPYLRYTEFNDIINRLIDMIAALQSSLGPASLAASAAAATATAAGNPPGTPVGDEAVDKAVALANVDTFGAIEIYAGQVNNLLNTIKSQKILGT
jgi:hypothetical protein